MKFGKILFIASVLLIIYALFGAIIKTSILKQRGKCAKAVLTGELSSYTHRYTHAYLLYEFSFRGKKYTGNSLENDQAKVGDSVCVVYLESFPSINRAMKYFDSGEIKCNCNK